MVSNQTCYIHNKILLLFGYSFYYNKENIYFLLRRITWAKQNHQLTIRFPPKKKMKKRKNPQKNIESFPFHPPGGGQH
jgi:hypothetical protein